MTTTSRLIAFHGDPAIKARYVARVMAHQEADEIVHGRYWEYGKGCGVGCTIHSSCHNRYELELGIPESLAWMEDRIFECMFEAKAKGFPLAFLQVIKVGSDLSLVVPHMAYWLLTTRERWDIAEDDKPMIALADLMSANCLRLIKGEAFDQPAWVNSLTPVGDWSLRSNTSQKLCTSLSAIANLLSTTRFTGSCIDSMLLNFSSLHRFTIYQDFFDVVADKLLELLAAAPVIPVPIPEG